MKATTYYRTSASAPKFAALLLLALCTLAGAQPVSSVAPLTISTIPTNSQMEVSIYDAVSAFFSEDMDASSLTTSSFQLLEFGTNPVPGSVTYDAMTRRAVFQPTSQLTRRASFTGLLTADVRTASGTSLGTSLTWEFSTTGLEEPDIGPVALGGNDDGSTAAIALPFPVAVYGGVFSNIWINNNGNITFDGPLNEYTAFAFPGNRTIIAGFFADVDTRPAASGKVHYRATTNRVVITWNRVGYYNQQTDKRNRFQILLTREGLIGFSYDDMEWTTGSASGGSGGFGGSVARAGFDAGNGIDAVVLFEGNTPDSLLTIRRRAFYFTSLGGSPQPNLPPVANAGTNQVVEQATPAGTLISLDGSASTDDGVFRALTYSWREGDVLLGTGVRLDHVFPAGNHAVTLFAFDGQLTGSNTIQITVQDTTPPDTFFIGGPGEGAIINATNVLFTASGSDNGSLPQQLVFSYSVDGGAASDFGPATQTISSLADGPHTVQAVARDLSGNVDPVPAVRSFTVDTQPPVISGVSASPGVNRAEITWLTDELTGGSVVYGLTDAFGFTNIFTGSPRTSHQVVLTGLTPETLYFFRVVAVDLAGNVSVLNGTPFTTRPAPDLVVSNLVIGDTAPLVSGDEITVRWTDINIGNGPAVTSFDDLLIVSNATLGQVLGSVRVAYQAGQAGAGPINPGEQRPRQASFRLPDGFPGAGTIECHVSTDAGNSVFEHSAGADAEANNDAVAARTASLRPYPDLVVTNIAAPIEAYTERTFNLAWTICNQGPGVAADRWADRVYLSTDDQIGNDRLLAEFPFNGSLAPGECLTRIQSVTISRAGLTEGPFYIVIATDTYGDVFELTNENNNVFIDADAMALRFSPQPNLQVSAVLVSTNVFSSQQTVVEWAVTNAGNGSTGGAGWQDYVWLSTDASLDGSDTFLGQAQNASYLNGGDSYRGTLAVTLPRAIEGDYFFIVHADASHQVNEFGLEHDNLGMAESHVTLTPPPDLQVGSVRAPATAFSGQSIDVSWRITNSGPGRTLEGVWFDQIYLSETNLLDGTARSLGTEFHSGALNSGEEYEVVNRSVVLPIGISGTFYLLVRADTFNQVFEHVSEGNNVGSETTPTVINLTPPPDLEIEQIDVPANAIANQALAVSCRIANNGATVTPNSSWSDRCYLSSDAILSRGSDLLLGSRVHFGALEAGQSYTASFTGTLPVGLSGTFYAIVETDFGNEVFELVKSNNVSVSSRQVAVEWRPPDLAVEFVTAPATALASHALTVNYRVANLGTGPTPNASWNEHWYLSADEVLDVTSDLLMSSRNHFGRLNPGQFYNGSFTLRLPDTLTGAFYAFVQIDAANEVLEQVKANNVNVSSNAVAVESRPADLVVTALNAARDAKAGSAMLVSWSVRNQGVGDTADSRWHDRVILSGDAVPGNQGDLILLTREHLGLLDAGESYVVDGVSVVLPLSLAPGSYHLFVITDSTNQVYEAAAENNNVSTPVLINVTRETADLRVTAVNVPDAAQGGQPLPIEWAVENASPTRTYATYWSDKVYLSTDAALDAGDLLIATRQHSNELPGGGAYSNSVAHTFRPESSGQYYVIVLTDSDDRVLEPGAESNNWLASTNSVVVTPAPLPDLAVTAVSAPTEGFSGQSFEVSWTVRNVGPGEAAQAWYDSVYLSLDQLLDRSSDLYAGFADRPRPLASGEEYVRTARFNIPTGLVGPFYVFVTADSGASVAERLPELNNTAYDGAAMFVRLQPPADLVVGTITIPTNAVAGQSVTLTYTVRNIGPNTASGSWVDSIYFSADENWDLDDILFSRVTHSGAVPPGGSYTETVTAPLPGLVPGNYHVIVRSDIRNQLPESDETNNLDASLDRVSIDVPLLTLGTPANGELGAGEFVFYKVVVGPADTLVIDFNSSSATAFNELYVRYGGLPTRSQHDFLYNRPNEPDQSITVPITRAGTYYIAAYGNSGFSGPAPYEIIARILPFGMTRILPARAGNVGFATVRIEGALFDPFTRVQLIGHGHTNEPVWLKRVDQTILHATFDLRSLTPGVYDVRLYSEQPLLDLDPTTHEIIDYIAVYGDATVTGAFTIESGGGARAHAQMSLPSSARFGNRFTFHVEIANHGNTDLPIPVYQVSSPNGTPFSTFPDFRSSRGSQEQLLALGAIRPEVLAPGERVIIPLYATAIREPSSRFQLQSLATMTGLVPWDTLESVYRDDTPELAWRQTWANFRSLVGNTWPEFQSALTLLAVQLAPSRSQPYLTGNRMIAELLARARRGQTTLAPAEATVAAAYAASRAHLLDFTAGRDRDRRERQRADAPVACTATLSTEALLAAEARTRATCLVVLYGLFGSEVGDLWSLYLGSDSSSPPPLQSFSDGSTVANGFKNSQTTKEFLDIVMGAAEDKILEQIKSGAISCSSPSTVPASNVLPPEHLRPGVMLDYNQPLEIPGNIAGGVGAGQDDRRVTGSFSIKPVKDNCGKITSVDVEANFTIIVDDVIDFCPGNLSSGWETFCTVPMAALEANDWAYDVPIHVEYTTDPRTFSIPGGSLPEDCNKKKCPPQPPGPCDPPCREDECDQSPGSPNAPDCCEGSDCDDVPTVRPIDPNDIVGPAGFGPQHWIGVTQPLGYTIRFENDPRLATAPAQVVRITQQLDPHLDFRTFRLGDLGFGTRRIHVPENRSFFQTVVDLRQTHGILVEISAGINVATGEAFWQFTSLDPDTGDLPSDALAGFLPVNTNAPAGEGFVSYTVRARNDVQNGDVVNAQARIIFDINEPLDTPPIFNTLDVGAPVSLVQELPPLTTNTTFLLAWAGSDPAGGSAIANYDIYVSTDNGPFLLWLAATPETSGYVIGERGHRYAFYSQARDNAGNQEGPPAFADAIIRISDNLAPSLAAIANFEVPVGANLRITNTATDANLPAQALRFSLSPGAPAGVSINADSGLLRWQPQARHAGVAHPITVIVTDNGEPPLGDARTFTVAVPDHVELAVGSGEVQPGQSGVVLLSAVSSATLSSLAIELDLPASTLLDPTGVVFSAAASSASVAALSSSRWLLTLLDVTIAGATSEQPVLSLHFTAAGGQPSAFLPLTTASIRAARSDGSVVQSIAGRPGRVAVIAAAPLLEARQGSQGRELRLFGNVGSNYVIQASTGPVGAPWLPWWEGSLTNVLQIFALPATNSPGQFFRAATP